MLLPSVMLNMVALSLCLVARRVHSSLVLCPCALMPKPWVQQYFIVEVVLSMVLLVIAAQAVLTGTLDIVASAAL